MVIYKITNMINGKIYVGKDCANNPAYIGSGLLISSAIKKYGKHNFKKEILQECRSKKDLDVAEKYWIKLLGATDLQIGYNIADGGQGGKQPLHVRIRQSKTQCGKKWMYNPLTNLRKLVKEDDVQEFLRNGYVFGRNMTDEQKSSISEKKKANKEATKKMVATRRLNGSYVLSDERKLQISKQVSGENNPFYGKHHTEESKQKIRENSKSAVGENNPFYGKHHTEETKQKMRKDRGSNV